MEIYEIILFLITFGIALLNLMFYVSLWADSAISWPPLLAHKITNPNRWYLLYPSMFYQIWFWFNLYGFFG